MWKFYRIYNLIYPANKLHTKKKKRRGNVIHEKILKRRIYQSNTKHTTCSDPYSDKWTIERHF